MGITFRTEALGVVRNMLRNDVTVSCNVTTPPFRGVMLRCYGKRIRRGKCCQSVAIVALVGNIFTIKSSGLGDQCKGGSMYIDDLLNDLERRGITTSVIDDRLIFGNYLGSEKLIASAVQFAPELKALVLAREAEQRLRAMLGKFPV